MEGFFQWSLELIAALQQIHPALHAFFRGFTFLGQPDFYVLLLPLLLWCVDIRLGARLGVFLLLSSQLNAVLKALFHMPRPCDFDPSLQLTWFEGAGLPSGHAQFAVLVWGTMAAWVRRCWFWAMAIVLMILVGLSRIYLGVHFPTDVIAGWAVGAISLIICLAVQPRTEEWVSRLGLGWQLALALMVPISLILTHFSKDTATAMGALAGVGSGVAVAHRYVPFNATGPWWQRVLRLVVGGAIAAALYGGLRIILPGQESSLYLIFRFLRLLLVGLWATLGAPWLFQVLHLAPQAETVAP